jgi:hypothetical protein
VAWANLSGPSRRRAGEGSRDPLRAVETRTSAERRTGKGLPRPARPATAPGPAGEATPNRRPGSLRKRVAAAEQALGDARLTPGDTAPRMMKPTSGDAAVMATLRVLELGMLEAETDQTRPDDTRHSAIVIHLLRALTADSHSDHHHFPQCPVT